MRGAPGAPAERQPPPGARQHRRHLRAQARRAHRAPPSARCSSRSPRNAPLPEVLASITALDRVGRSPARVLGERAGGGRPDLRRRGGAAPAGGAARGARAAQRRHPQRLLRRLRSTSGARCWWRTSSEDPFWQRARATLALEAGLRAAWSTPIKAAGGQRARRARRLPRRSRAADAAESQIMAHAAQLAGIAIERRLRRGGAARQRGEVPRPVREHRRRGLPERPRRAAAVGQPGLRRDARLRQRRGDVRAAERRGALLEPGRPRRVRAPRGVARARSATRNSCMRRRDGAAARGARERAPDARRQRAASSATKARSPTSPSASAPSRRCSPRRSARR